MKYLLHSLIFLACSVAISAQNNVGPGNALSFDGTNDWVDLGPSLQSMTLPVTISVWVKPNTTTQKSVFVSNKSTTQTTYHGVWLNVANDRVNVSIGDGSGGHSANSRRTYLVNYPSNFSGEWIHIAAVVSGLNNMEIYVNGIVQPGAYSGSGSTFANNFNGNAWIGKGQGDNPNFFNGEIDEFSLWDRALTVNEIRDLMCRKIDPNAPDLLIAYDFNEANTSNSFNNLGSIGQNGVRNGANTVASEAPVGDSSVHAYTIVSQAVSLSMSGDLFQLTDLQAPTEGVHLYKILNDNSIPTGSGCVDDDSYGIFIADDDFSNNDDYDLAIGNSGSLAYTRTSILNIWQTSGPLATGHSYHNQYVLEASQMHDFLPGDTTLCQGQPITITITEPGSYVWDDGSTSASRTISTTGTYWATLTVGGCSSTDTIEVTAYNDAFLPFTDTAICATDSILFEAPGAVLMWPDGSGGPRYLFPGNTYVVSVESGACQLTANIQVATLQPPSDLDLEDEYVFCEGQSVEVTLPPLAGTITWNDGSTAINRTLRDEGIYWVEITTSCSVVSDTFVVRSESCEGPNLFIPNAFTPNADGLNDELFIGNLQGVDFSLMIYSRWGQVVFQTSNAQVAWDGTIDGYPLPEGVYSYRIDYYDARGDVQTRSGLITLIR